MTKTKHTPGAWIYQKGTNTIRSEKENYWLATMDSWDGAVNHEANAHLIAAAPELLEALKGIIEIGKRDMSNQKYDSYFEYAKQAIAKAEGKN